MKFNPDDDKQNLFVVGCSDKKIYTVSPCVYLSLRVSPGFDVDTVFVNKKSPYSTVITQ